MTTYTLEGKHMVVDEKRLIDLANRWLPKEMSAKYKRQDAYLEYRKKLMKR